MSKKLKDLIKEDDDAQLDLGGDAGGDAGDDESSGGPGELTLKLTGLPDDVDLDGVGVDLVASDDEEEDVADDVDMGDEGSDDGADLGDLDLGDSDGQSTGDQMESMRLSDDTIVEIDENMLRREIARMKKIREDASSTEPGDANGHGVDAAVMDDFGGGADDGDQFLDGEVTTESDDIDEADDMDELSDRRKADERGVSADSDMGVSKTEGLARRIRFEKRLQERAKARAASIKKEAKAKPSKKAQLQKEYRQVAVRFNASVARTNKFTKLLSETKKQGSRLNSGSTQPAESKADNGLRKQLAEKNLLNAKLIYANKLLQNESLSKKQKAQIIERLDDAKNVREAKLVYESITKALTGRNKPLRESTESKVLGSSSRVMRSGSSQTLNEGFETDRWATLAGITKK